MSVWQDKPEDNPSQPAASMADVIFKIDCAQLPVDHAAALSHSICTQVPWLADLEKSGIHAIHVAGSQNGWQRPELESNDLLLLSKRTRLKVRVPHAHAQKLIDTLCHTAFTVDGHALDIVSGRISSLQPSETLFSRYTVYAGSNSHIEDEPAFLQQAIDDCEKLGYRPTKLLCGRSQIVTTPTGKVTARSLLLADVPAEYSIMLQDCGLGSFRLMGCGIVIPHKDTSAVS